MPGKILSIFIDESGDFGAYEAHAPYYLVALVYHDQIRALISLRILHLLRRICNIMVTGSMPFIQAL